MLFRLEGDSNLRNANPKLQRTQQWHHCAASAQEPGPPQFKILTVLGSGLLGLGKKISKPLLKLTYGLGYFFEPLARTSIRLLSRLLKSRLFLREIPQKLLVGLRLVVPDFA